MKLPRTSLFENPRYARPAPEPPSMTIGTLPRLPASLDCGDVTYLRHGSGPPLLLVHGIPTSARLWEPLLGDLGERFDCIVPDLLGLGRSRARPGVDVSSPGQATMLAQLLDHLGIDEAFAAFHDQGGAHGLRFLEAHGNRVPAFAAANIVCYDNWVVPAIAVMMAAARAPRLLHAAARTGIADLAFMRMWPFPQTTIRAPTPKTLEDDWMAAMRAGGADLEAFSAYVLAQSPVHTQATVPTLRAWTKPALIAWAAHDYFLPPSWAAKLCADIPGADDQPVLWPFAGHFFHTDVPVSAARTFGDFFASVGP